jgi:transcription antitermination factor NusB
MTEEELSSAIWFKNKHKEKLIDYLENDFLIMPVIHYLWSEGFEYIAYDKNPSVRFSSPNHMIRRIAAKHPLKILDEPKKLTKQNAEKILFNLSGLDKFLETTKEWLDSDAAIMSYHTYINTRGIDDIKGIYFKSFYNNYRTGKNQIFKDLELEKDKIKNIIDDLIAEIPASEITNLERNYGSILIGSSINKVTFGSDLLDLFEIFKEKADIEEIIKINDKLPLAIKDRWLVDDPDIFEEKFINWSVDKDVLQALVAKTFKNFSSTNPEENNLAEICPNWDEDRSFLIDLLKKVISFEKEYQELIAQKTKNWDSERIALMDTLLMRMAITELIHFSTIPIKVSMNEYIEISKDYSTPKSNSFINGILDKILADLKSAGKVRKTGKGLL